MRRIYEPFEKYSCQYCKRSRHIKELSSHGTCLGGCPSAIELYKINKKEGKNRRKRAKKERIRNGLVKPNSPHRKKLLKQSVPKKPLLTGEKYKKWSEEFLSSPRWHSLRYEAFLKHGRQCQCCGAKPPQVVLHVDHVKPRYNFPELAYDINNLQVLCAECNKGKGAKHQTDFRRR